MPGAWLISREDFLRWNPGIGPNCENFLTEWSYCVEAIEEPPASSSTVPQPPTSTTSGGPGPTSGIATPTPTQPGMVDNCNAFAFVEPGTSCSALLASHGITLAELMAWNPSVGSNCESLWANVYVCVGVVGGSPPPSSSSSSWSTTTTTPTPTNGIPTPTPTPTQPGMVADCDAFAFVEAGQTCDAVALANGISFAELLAWNPSVGAGCEGLWANVYVCVSVVGHAPSPTTTVPPTTTTNGVQTPTPTQTGMVGKCASFHLVSPGQTCQVIADLYRITLAAFVAWNPAVGSDCTGLWANTYACVGLI